MSNVKLSLKHLTENDKSPRAFLPRCVNSNYESVVFYPAIGKSITRGYAIVEGMVGTFIEGADGKMRPALCGGHDTGIQCPEGQKYFIKL